MANEILKFGTNVLASNILTQAAYSAANPSDRTVGHVPGIAKNTLENKALVQATAAANGLAYWADTQQNTIVTITDQMPDTDWLTAINAAVNASVSAASLTVSGKVELATALETVPAIPTLPTDTARAVTAAGMIDPNVVTTQSAGRVRLPGGIIIQWGTFLDSIAYVSGVPPLRSFPVAFPQACFFIGGITMTANATAWIGAAPTTTQYSIGSGTSANATMTIRWYAVGN
jgi:hypothetical protein